MRIDCTRYKSALLHIYGRAHRTGASGLRRLGAAIKEKLRAMKDLECPQVLQHQLDCPGMLSFVRQPAADAALADECT